MSQKKNRWLVRGDVDGFFGLFIDNLIQLMLISVVCRYVCGFSADFVADRILPGVALSILAGNLFYSWQARDLAARSNRPDVTALPFGINTVSLLAFIFLVMGPVYYETEDPEMAWKAGLVACLLSGVIEMAGAFGAGWLKKHTPRAALLAGLGGVALSFMTLGFAFQVFASPAIAMIPMMLVLIVYGARVKLPLRLPGGVVAIGVGIVIAYLLRALGLTQFSLSDDPVALSFHVPRPALVELASIFTSPMAWSYLSVVIPVALFNVIGSIENLESAEAAGDRFPVKSSLLVNGATSLLAAVLGSPFPTSIYIGHPGWKSMGARTGYSVLNGAVITTLCVFGGVTALLKVVPMESTLGILIWIGSVIVAQAFMESDRKHAIAVVIGFVPPLAAWVLHIIESSLRVAGTNLYETIDQFRGELYVDGIISLYQGFLLIAILLPAIVAHVIDRQFVRAAVWSFAGAALSAIGLIHAYQLTPTGIHNNFGWMAAPWHAFSYAFIGVALLVIGKLKRRSTSIPSPQS